MSLPEPDPEEGAEAAGPTMGTGITRLAMDLSRPCDKALAFRTDPSPVMFSRAKPLIMKEEAGGALNFAMAVPEPTDGCVVLISI
jgi:hypothetical protein